MYICSACSSCVRCTWIRSRAAVLRNRAVAHSQAAGPSVLRIHAAPTNRSRMSIVDLLLNYVLTTRVCKVQPAPSFLFPAYRFRAFTR